MTGYGILAALLASLALTLWGARRRSWAALLLASILALVFCIPEAPAVGFFILGLPMLQFGLALWHLIRVPTPVRILLCVAAATIFITQVVPAIARLT